MKDIDFWAEGGLIGLESGRVLVGLGPYTTAPSLPPGRTAFYAPDFFLADEEPWKIPATTLELSATEFAERFPPPPGELPTLTWEEPDPLSFRRVLAELKACFHRGELAKAVPLVFSRATLPVRGDTTCLSGLARQAVRARPNLRPYGFWRHGEGLVGATPELLFAAPPGGGVQSMALAGTYPADQAAALLKDPKELVEHDLVVEDILAVLSSFGPVTRDPLTVLDLGSMVHMLTRVYLDGTVDFATLVDALHPTPALGVAPRSAGWDWLAAQDRGVDRGRFGAPFGLVQADGSGFCLVAIRNLMWSDNQVRIGSGSGIVPASVEEREWQELAAKRNAVKDTFGL